MFLDGRKPVHPLVVGEGLVVMGDDLSIDAAASVMCQIMSGEATPAQLGSLLTGLRLKGETTEEIAGMAAVMREILGDIERENSDA